MRLTTADTPWQHKNRRPTRRAPTCTAHHASTVATDTIAQQNAFAPAAACAIYHTTRDKIGWKQSAGDASRTDVDAAMIATVTATARTAEIVLGAEMTAA